MSNDSFQKKFKDQIQIMGKGGITSIQSNQPILPYQNNMNNYNIPQNQQNMINMNYQNMNYGNLNFNPQQQFMNNNFNNNMMNNNFNNNMMNNNFNNNMMNNNFNNNMMNNNFNNNKKNNKKKNNDFSGWAEIYNQELKNDKNNNNIPKINNRIKSGGEMVMASNKNKQVNDKVKKPKQNKSTTPQPQKNNINMNHNNQFQMNPMNLMNPQMMMNNPNFNPYAPYQQMMMNNNFNQMQMNNNFNNNNFNQMQMNNNFNNNNYNNYNNNNNFNYINENSKNINSNRNNKSIQYVEYKPYTLKDYKELTRSKVVMGPLGANIGTKEWEEKKAKMKRMETYSNRINQTHKGINKLKKDTPQEEIEKNLKLKMENSHRYRTYEYGKLIRSARNYDANSKISAITGNNDNYYKDLGVINENEEYRIKTGDVKNFNTHSNSNNNLDFNEDNNNLILSNEKDNKFEYTFKKDISNLENEENNNNNININNNNNVPSLQSLIEQNENYKAKIADIKDSLL